MEIDMASLGDEDYENYTKGSASMFEGDGDTALPDLRLMTTASTPATPGPTSPLDHSLGRCEDDQRDIFPPARPKSTPFPQQEHLNSLFQPVRRESEERRREGRNTAMSLPILDPPGNSKPSPIWGLPTEIHEFILDHLFGCRNPVARVKTTHGRSNALRNWNSALRHARRREVSELALVSKKWRPLVQERLYRHIKIKATRCSLNRATAWFLSNPDLCSYVKHIEFWFPVFEHKTLDNRTVRITVTQHDMLFNSPIQTLEPADTLTHHALTYQSPTDNCTLEEVFRFTQITFVGACVLSLEGGDRKKPPMVKHFRGDFVNQPLAVLPTITTLVCKGQWNLIRQQDDFQRIANALPNLIEWHGAYAKPKSKSYICMATIFPKLPTHITHLSLVMENEYRRESQCPTFFRKVGQVTHLCREMAKAMPALEHFAYTGRVCRSFFDDAAKLSDPRTSRLKSIELTVKNLCRPPVQWNDGSGISDMGFIYAFEALVESAVRSLDTLKALEHVKIKYIDLDSLIPSWNPFFQLTGNACLGLWSDNIIKNLMKSRPSAVWLERNVNPRPNEPSTWVPSTIRTRSLKVSDYVTLNAGININ